jgi:hypothetical protein
MTVQSVVAVGLTVFSFCIAALIARYRLLGYWGWIIASAVVALGGVLALWDAPDQAGSLTATLFVLVIAAPLTLLNRARRAARHGQWRKAARLHRWAAVLHPSPWTRFGAALTGEGPEGYATALTRIEATGSRKQRALASLLLAHEQRDWERLLMLSRARDVGFSEAKPREIRALGELGHREEMVKTYLDAARSLLRNARQECMLFVFAFTGRVDRVRQLLEGPLADTDTDSKSYWTAVARLQNDNNDEGARSMLERLAETSTQVRVRRSAAHQLRHTSRQVSLPLALRAESQHALDAMNHLRADHLTQWVERTRPARMKAALCLIVLAIIWAVLQRYFGW